MGAASGGANRHARNRLFQAWCFVPVHAAAGGPPCAGPTTKVLAASLRACIDPVSARADPYDVLQGDAIS